MIRYDLLEILDRSEIRYNITILMLLELEKPIEKLWARGKTGYRH